MDAQQELPTADSGSRSFIRWVPCTEGCVRDNAAWVQCEPSSSVPKDAVVGGLHSDGTIIYAGRAHHNGEILVGRVMPNEKCAYVGVMWIEYKKTNYEVLTGTNFKWLPGANGSVPPNAVIGGTMKHGETTYIGRGLHEGSLIVGKVHPSQTSLFIPFGGKEHRFYNYDVLTYTTPLADCAQLDGSSGVPKDAVIGGHDSNGGIIYVGRAHHKGEVLVGRVMPNEKCVYVGVLMVEYKKTDYEMLTGTNFKWLPGANGSVPPNAVIGGVASSGEKLYIGRGLLEGSLLVGKVHPSQTSLFIPFGGKEHRFYNYEVLTQFPAGEDSQACSPCSPSTCWESTHGSCVPTNAVVLSDNPCSYVGRAFHRGDLLPAMVVPDKACAYVCYAGKQVKKSNFEVLLYDEYSWKSAENGYIPSCAVEGGRTAQEEPLYIGRTQYLGTMTMGKVQQSHGCMYIGVDGNQVAVKSYEILVYGRH